MIQAYAVPAVAPDYDLLRLTWPRVEPMLSEAAMRDGQDINDVLERLIDGDAQLWVAVDGDNVRVACVTYIVSRCCHLWICAGSQRQDWISFLDYIKEWARHHECDRMSLRGRKGWARVFRHWKITSIEMECRLDG